MSSRCACTPLARLPAAARSNNLNLTRPFSTTSAKLNVPPEHPGWIQFPRARQDQESEKKLPKIKGTLPVPRDVFPRKEAERKLAPGYIEETMPKPTSEESKKPAPPGSHREFRQRMADTRRENLEVALGGLYNRKKQHVEAAKAVSKRRLRDHQRAANAPERWDDRLTRSSVLSSLAKTTAVQLDPERYARAEESKAKTAALAQKKKDAREDALMELYISASNFIVTEEELTKECDALFSEDYWRREGRTTAHDADNAWGVWGQPPMVKDMLDEMLRGRPSAVDYQLTGQDRTVKRQKTVAEELTGGKME